MLEDTNSLDGAQLLHSRPHLLKFKDDCRNVWVAKNIYLDVRILKNLTVEKVKYWQELCSDVIINDVKDRTVLLWWVAGSGDGTG